MIAISKEVLMEEINLAQRILKKWEAKVAQGVPGEDIPGDELSADAYLREFVAEFLLVAGKLENMANIINSVEQG